MSRILGTALTLAFVLASVGSSQTVDQSRGVDARVDYASLTQFGPWDDRNYQLTKDDLALLSDNEAELRLAVPAFYRVEMRKRIPDLLREGKVQYPHSAVPGFMVEHGGFLVDGVMYRDVDRVGDRYVISLTDGFDPKTGPPVKALDGNTRVSPNATAAESAVAINPIDPDIVIAGSNGPGGGQKMYWSDDGGETWTLVNLPLGGTCCDPALAWSSDGTKGYAAALKVGNPNNENYFYRTADGGKTWTDLDTEPGNDPRREIGVAGTDKEFLHVDLSPTSPHLDNIYLTWHQSNTLFFARSTDFGHTWSTPITVSTGSTERGIGSDITTDSAGNIYYVWAGFVSRKIYVVKSTDGGLTFSSPATEVADLNASFNYFIPSQETRGVAIICSADTDRSGGPNDGSIYVAWTDTTGPEQGNPADNHGQVKVAHSRDGGATWTESIPHETADVNDVDRWQPWMTVAPDGSVHVVFNDTRNSTNRSGIDLYHSFSTDGGVTWSAPTRETTETSRNASGNFEFGDYSGMDIVMNRLIAVYTDNRDENGGTSQSRDIYAIGKTLIDALFTDGFESNDTSDWDLTVP